MGRNGRGSRRRWMVAPVAGVLLGGGLAGIVQMGLPLPHLAARHAAVLQVADRSPDRPADPDLSHPRWVQPVRTAVVPAAATSHVAAPSPPRTLVQRVLAGPLWAAHSSDVVLTVHRVSPPRVVVAAAAPRPPTAVLGPPAPPAAVPPPPPSPSPSPGPAPAPTPDPPPVTVPPTDPAPAPDPGPPPDPAPVTDPPPDPAPVVDPGPASAPDPAPAADPLLVPPPTG